MKQVNQLLLLISVCCLCTACSNVSTNKVISANKYYDLEVVEDGEYLTRVSSGQGYELGNPCAYVNTKGDTIVALGNYDLCLTDTIRTFGIVWNDTTFIGIDRQGRKLYEVYYYDNGPDWVQDGLFRILRDNKIGYADEQGYIIIEPQFECANPFENGHAKVTYSCQLIPEGEYTRMESEEWFHIDTQGNQLERDD
jgi:hypothetical protein